MKVRTLPDGRIVGFGDLSDKEIDEAIAKEASANAPAPLAVRATLGNVQQMGAGLVSDVAAASGVARNLQQSPESTWIRENILNPVWKKLGMEPEGLSPEPAQVMGWARQHGLIDTPGLSPQGPIERGVALGFRGAGAGLPILLGTRLGLPPAQAVQLLAHSAGGGVLGGLVGEYAPDWAQPYASTVAGSLAGLRGLGMWTPTNPTASAASVITHLPSLLIGEHIGQWIGPQAAHHLGLGGSDVGWGGIGALGGIVGANILTNAWRGMSNPVNMPNMLMGGVGGYAASTMPPAQ